MGGPALSAKSRVDRSAVQVLAEEQDVPLRIHHLELPKSVEPVHALGCGPSGGHHRVSQRIHVADVEVVGGLGEGLASMTVAAPLPTLAKPLLPMESSRLRTSKPSTSV